MAATKPLAVAEAAAEAAAAAATAASHRSGPTTRRKQLTSTMGPLVAKSKRRKRGGGGGPNRSNVTNFRDAAQSAPRGAPITASHTWPATSHADSRLQTGAGTLAQSGSGGGSCSSGCSGGRVDLGSCSDALAPKSSCGRGTGSASGHGQLQLRQRRPWSRRKRRRAGDPASRPRPRRTQPTTFGCQQPSGGDGHPEMNSPRKGQLSGSRARRLRRVWKQ